MERNPARFPLLPCLLLALLGGSANAQGVADTFARPVAWQIALEREGFSPGIIDGKPGAKTELATREYQRYAGLPPSGRLDEATAKALAIDEITPFNLYRVTAEDLAGIAPELHDWNQKAAQSYLGYYSALDALAEKFHTSKRFLQAINPEVVFDTVKPGSVILAPRVLDPVKLSFRSLRVDLGKKVIFLIGADGRTTGLVHCSIAANVAKRPSGEGQVVVVAPNPNYTFNPESWPEVHNVARTLLIPPGPRNPVGLYWIGLNLPGYGIHGTPIPENIGKTGSHGCFRLANWDAVRLGSVVRVGMRVEFISESGQRPTTAPTTRRATTQTAR
jgi:lipoprotein-anchoring transpeptidase ErfK/SrfK